MSDLRPGTPVVFRLGRFEHIGTIERPEIIGAAAGYYVNGPDGAPGPWLVFTEDLAPILADGTRVKVAAGAPLYPGTVGTVRGAEIRAEIFGYLITPHDAADPPWVPAAALVPLTDATREM